jgi:hypothetical protein
MTGTWDTNLQNDDIAWFLQESAAALGLHGAGFEPSGTRSPEEQVEAMIVRVLMAKPAARRFQRVYTVWRIIPHNHRDTLVVYYSTAGELPAGASTRLGRFATVALWQAGATGLRALKLACSQGHGKLLVDSRERAENAVKAAHRAVKVAEQRSADLWASEGRPYERSQRDLRAEARFNARDTDDRDYRG